MMGELVIGQDMMAACPAPMNLPDTINLGAIFALSGPISVYGGPQQQAVQLAEQQINDMGYLGDGTMISFQFEDSTGSAEAGDQRHDQAGRRRSSAGSDWTDALE